VLILFISRESKMTEIVNGKEVEVKFIGVNEVRPVLNSIRNGQIFTVIFTKKDGSERKMNCKRGVKKGQAGGKLNYNPADYGLMSVFDMKLSKTPEKAYRMLNCKTTSEIRSNKVRYFVTA
jgi:hypothetical protein